MVETFCTGCEAISAETSVTVRVVVAPTSRTSNVWDSLAVAGNSPAFSVSMPDCVLSLTKSTPSTVNTSAPRARLAGDATAGDPGSVYATTIWRGGTPEIKTHRRPYPTCTPPCERASQSEVR